MPTKRKYGAIIAYVDIFFDDYRIFYTKSVTRLVHIRNTNPTTTSCHAGCNGNRSVASLEAGHWIDTRYSTQ